MDELELKLWKTQLKYLQLRGVFFSARVIF